MRKLVRLTCVFALGAFALDAQTVPVSNTVQTTGMVGIGYAQTAQLNLLNVGLEPVATSASCTATVSFVDENGATLKTGTLLIAPGKSASLDLHSDSDLNLAVNARKEIRAVISTPSTIPPPTAIIAAPSCTLLPTLEMIDTPSGRTLVILGHVTTVPSLVATPATN